MDSISSKPSKKDIFLGILAYLTIIGLLISILLNRKERASFPALHIRQSLGITIIRILMLLGKTLPVIGLTIFQIGVVIVASLSIVGIFHAATGKAVPVPVLGNQFEKWFKGIY